VFVIGVVFLVLAALAVAAAISTGRDVNVQLDGYGVSATTSVLWIFCAGAIAMLCLVIALSAFRRAGRRRRARRRELKQLRAEESETAAIRAAHRDDAVDVRDDQPTAMVSEPGPERRYVPDDDRA